MVVLIEVSRKAYLASIVPVVVNAILNEHQIIVDIVAFVNRGDFPRSRLGEKQRGKILAGWVSRKMRTVAQFAIKDVDAAGALSMVVPSGPAAGDAASQGAGDVLENHRASQGSFRSSGGYGGPIPGTSSSLRNVEPAPQILEQRELEQQLEGTTLQSPSHLEELGPVEMPADEQAVYETNDGEADGTNEQTPTRPQHKASAVATPPQSYALPDFNSFGPEDTPPSLRPGGPNRLPTGSEARLGSSGGDKGQTPTQLYHSSPPQIRLPAIDGRESLDDWNRPVSTVHGGAEEDDWTRDAYMSMNLAGTLARREDE